METAELIDHLDRQGTSLARAASDTGLDATVPTCPGWQVRDLVQHTGTVHRWATGYLTEGHTSFQPFGPAPDLADAALLSWFEQGHAALVAALRVASADLACWTFLPALPPREFWARRQLHETTIHRADAESARGARPDGIGLELAVDGIDELLAGFHARSSSKVRTQSPRVLRIRATDTSDVWTLHLSADPPVTERHAQGDADCEVSGPAADLYLALWNRAPFPSVSGTTPALADLWQERSSIV